MLLFDSCPARLVLLAVREGIDYGKWEAKDTTMSNVGAWLVEQQTRRFLRKAGAAAPFTPPEWRDPCVDRK